MTLSGTVDDGSSIYALNNFPTKGRWENISSLIVPCCSLTPDFKDGSLAYFCPLVTAVHGRLSTAEVQQGFARDRLVLMSCSASISSLLLLQYIGSKLLNWCLTISISSGPSNPWENVPYASWGTQEARNCLCRLAASWRKKQSAPPSRQSELNLVA